MKMIQFIKKMGLMMAAFAIVLGASNPVHAENKTNNDTAQAENYFQQLKTVKSRFVQTAADGSQTRGTFYLSRPGKLRFEYDPPSKDFVVADGFFIYFYDGEMKQQSNAPIGQTLADFLLRKDFKLSGDLKVTKIMRAGGYIQITVIQSKLPKAGDLTLAFTEAPKYQLKKWRVKDSVGNITETELFDMQTGLKLPSSLFAYRDPVAKGVNK
ncbi:MAG: outer-membrane lipoprotein carrier protein LolA [Alphaproteobacteria bacterium]|nr:outer-membrane lipoprotein carrier protein LolA [Alphaproteobacteria bacterium]